MNYANEDARAQKQREIDEQTLVDLDQSITEREQARTDRDQHCLDETQLMLDTEGPATDEDDFAALAFVNHHQTELGLAQHRSDAHQTQLDDNQGARDLCRNVLDNQQTLLDRLANLNVISNALPAAAAQRDRARRLRDVAALARAENAHRRSEQARHGVRACEHRKKDPGNRSWRNAA